MNPLIVLPLEAAALALILTICWLLVALPFAFLYHALKAVLKTAKEKLQEFSRHLWGKASFFFGKLHEPVKHFVEQNRQKIYFHELEQKLQRGIKALSGQISEIDDRAGNSVLSLAANTKNLSTSLDTIHDVSTSFPDIEIPEWSDSHQIMKVRRAGWTMVWTTLPFLLALTVLNTWMLSLFFSAMIDLYIWFDAGLKVGHVLAFMFSCFEIALGVILFILKDEKGDDKSPAVFEYVVYLVLGILAFIESIIYLKLSMEFSEDYSGGLADLSTASLLEFLETTWMTPFGIAIVFVLAITGHHFIKGVNRVRDAGDHGSFGQQLDDAHSIALNVSGLLEGAGEKLEPLKKQLATFLEELESVASDKFDLGKKISDATKNLRATLEGVQNLKSNLFIEISESESLREYYKSLFFAALGIILMVFFALIQTRLLSTAPIFSNFPTVMNAFLGCLLIGTLVGSGYVFAQRLIIAEGEPEATVQESPHGGFLRGAAAFIIIGNICFTAYITLIGQASPDWASFALMVALIAFSVLLGPSLRTFLQAIWALVQSGGLLLIGVLTWILGTVMAGFAVIMDLLATIIWVLAFPIIKLLQYFREGLPKASAGHSKEGQNETI